MINKGFHCLIMYMVDNALKKAQLDIFSLHGRGANFIFMWRKSFGTV